MINEIVFANEIIFLCSIIALMGGLLISFSLGKSALISFICLQSIFSNLFISKQVLLWGFHTTASDIFAVGGLLGMNVLQEYYGKKEASRTIIINIMFLALYLIIAQIHLLFIPSAYDVAHTAYTTILATLPRITLASLGVYAFVQWFDTQLYAVLKKLFTQQLIIRNTVSLICSQLIDTILFSFFALYGSVYSIQDIIIISSCIKLITILCMTPFVWFIKSYIRVIHD